MVLVKSGVLTVMANSRQTLEELVQNKFLKWLLGVNKYCNNNTCRPKQAGFDCELKSNVEPLSSGLL